MAVTGGALETNRSEPTVSIDTVRGVAAFIWLAGLVLTLAVAAWKSSRGQGLTIDWVFAAIGPTFGGILGSYLATKEAGLQVARGKAWICYLVSACYLACCLIVAWQTNHFALGPDEWGKKLAGWFQPFIAIVVTMMSTGGQTAGGAAGGGAAGPAPTKP